MANVTQGSAGADDANTGAHRFIGRLCQASGIRAGLTHEVHAAGVAVPTLLDNGNVDIHDIAIL